MMCSPRNERMRERWTALRAELTPSRSAPEIAAPTTVGSSPRVSDSRLVSATKAAIPMAPPVATCSTADPGRMPR